MTLTCDQVRDLAAAYVLDALDPDEADAVRDHLATCANPHAEVAELGSIVPLLLEDVPIIEPPDRLKGRIMAAAAADLKTRRPEPAVVVEATVSAPAPVTEPTAFPTPAEREARSAARAGPSRGSWALRIAAVLAIALLGGWNLLLQGQLGAARTYEQQVAAVLDVAGRPGSLTAVLTAEGGSGPAGLAAISTDGAVRIAMRDLAPTSGNEVYEAWVIGGDGVPVALGSFAVGASGVAYFEGSGLPTEAGIVLALTREPAAGATVPSGAPVSAGTATAG
ncbi:MAG: anti-sigma factor [Candidatus Limnocylindrales bacterium]